jgi:hypothetical protein
MLHDKAMGYLVQLKECTEAAVQIDLMQCRPSSIPAYSHSLLEFDLERLLDADLDTQQYWIAAMEATLATKNSPKQPSTPQATRRHHHSRRKALHSIAQIRRKITQ